MIVSYSRQFIFLNTWKAEGAVIEDALMPHCAPQDLIVNGRNPGKDFEPEQGHASAARVKAYIGDEAWNDFFKFAFVRNPWDVCVAAYWKWTRVNSQIQDQWVTLDAIREDFTRWLSTQPRRADFSIISIDGKVDLDFVGRYENLEQDFAQICDRLGLSCQLPARAIEKSKGAYRVGGVPYWKYYTDETRELIANENRELIEMFGYRFEDASDQAQVGIAHTVH